MKQEVRVRLITALVLVLVFAAGLSVGLAVDRPPTETAEAMSDTPAPTRNVETASRTDHDRVMKRIDLTKEQRVAVDSLLRFYQEKMTGFQREYGPRYWAIVDSSRTVIKEVLTEEQALLYDSLLVENDKRRGRPGAANPKP